MVQLTITRNEIRAREKKLRKLSRQDQDLVQELIKSLGTLSVAGIKKYRGLRWQDWAWAERAVGAILKEVTRVNLIDYLNEVNDEEYSEDTKRDIRLISS